MLNGIYHKKGTKIFLNTLQYSIGKFHSYIYIYIIQKTRMIIYRRSSSDVKQIIDKLEYEKNQRTKMTLSTFALSKRGSTRGQNEIYIILYSEAEDRTTKNKQ